MNIFLSLTGKPRGGTPLSYVYAIPVWYRLAATLITAILLAGALAVEGVALGWVVVVLSAIGALYEERWTFSSESRTVTARLGLLFLAKGPSFSFDDVALVTVDIFAKGRMDQSVKPEADKMPMGSQARLVVELKDGTRYLLDSVPFRARERIRRNADTLAAFMGVPAR